MMGRLLGATSSRLGIEGAEDHILVARDDAWAYYRVPIVSYEYLSDGEKEGLLARVSNALASLKDCQCHLLVVPREYDPRVWSQRLEKRAPRPSSSWNAYLRRLQEHVAGMSFWLREAYLGVRLGARDSGGPLAWRRRVERAAGVEDVAVKGRELTRWRDRAEPFDRAVSGHGLRARPVEHDELRWLVRRAFLRGLGEPPEHFPSRRSWGGAVDMLAEGTLHNGGRALTVGQREGRSHVASLALARFPDALPFPGGEWLYFLDAFDFPVEASVRFEIVPAHRAAKDAGKKLAEATDQARHIAGSSSELPLALMETAEKARRLEYSLTKEGVPLAYSWPRLVVSASTERELAARVGYVEELYRDFGLEVVQPAGDQLSLFLESLPGDRVRVPFYQQRQHVATLAGSMFMASAELGDGAGPYIGMTTGRTRVPVHFDPLMAPRTNNPAAIPIVGRSGSGKTTTANLLTYQMALQGVWITCIDPKEEMGRLAALPGMEDRARVLALGPEYAGLLDPFALATAPSEAVPVAAGVCQLLLPGRLEYAQNAAVLEACHAEASESPVPSLDGVVRRLEGGDETARRIASTLGVFATMPIGRLCFRGNDPVEALRPEGFLNVLQIQGLRSPDPATPRDDYTIDHRLAVSVLYLLAHFTMRLLESGKPSQPKAVVLDEAWMLTSTQQGRSLIPALSRIGRSKNGAVLLVSQNAGDLLGSEVVNNSSAKFAFRSTDSDEVASVLRLLGLAQTPDNIQAIQSLSTGECLLRDLSGRIGTVQIDIASDELLRAFDTTPSPEAAEVG